MEPPDKTVPPPAACRARAPALCLCLLPAAADLLLAQTARAQDLEPRAYAASPTGTNFLLAGFTNFNGAISLDPSLPIRGLQADIFLNTIGYDREFGFLGRSASVAILIPEVEGSLSGEVLGRGRAASRSGLADTRIRLALNLLGGPALPPRLFMERLPETTLGVSLQIVAPTGQYDPARLINIGNNRWAFKPEIGLSQPIGNWFAEAYAGAWIYTDNPNFYGGHRRSQAPIYSFQLHAGYTFRPGLWLAADATTYFGGTTSIDAGPPNDPQSVTRYGLTLSVPLGDGFSIKGRWSTWLASRNGGTYDTFGVTLQYRWFN